MKEETKALFEGLKITLKECIEDYDGLHWLNCKGNECLTAKVDWPDRILPGEYCGSISVDEESNYHKILKLLDRFEEVESTLANGGLVKDDAGNWLKHGDKIYFRRDKDGERQKGTLYYGGQTLCWYCCSEEGDWLYLGKDYDEVTWFVARFDV